MGLVCAYSRQIVIGKLNSYHAELAYILKIKKSINNLTTCVVFIKFLTKGQFDHILSNMNKLDSKGCAKIRHMLCEGESIGGICRLMGTSKNTVFKLLTDADAPLYMFNKWVL